MRTTGSDGHQTLRFRCPSCGDDNVRAVEWSSYHASLPCDGCGGFIDLTSEENLGAIQGAQPALNRQADQG